jgi:hypothetical protein
MAKASMRTRAHAIHASFWAIWNTGSQREIHFEAVVTKTSIRGDTFSILAAFTNGDTISIGVLFVPNIAGTYVWG